MNTTLEEFCQEFEARHKVSFLDGIIKRLSLTLSASEAREKAEDIIQECFVRLYKRSTRRSKIVDVFLELPSQLHTQLLEIILACLSLAFAINFAERRKEYGVSRKIDCYTLRNAREVSKQHFLELVCGSYKGLS